MANGLVVHLGAKLSKDMNRALDDAAHRASLAGG
jgi:hypothetical protein